MEAQFLEKSFYLKRNSAHIVPLDSRYRIQIDAQFIGMIEVRRANWMRMQLNAAEVDDPREPGGIIHHDFFGRPSRRKGKDHRSKPGRPLLRRALLIERLSLGTIHKTLQNDRAVLNSPQRSRSYRKVISHQIEFCNPDLGREVELVGMRDLDFTPIDRQNLAGCSFCHENRLSLPCESPRPDVPLKLCKSPCPLGNVYFCVARLPAMVLNTDARYEED